LSRTPSPWYLSPCEFLGTTHGGHGFCPNNKGRGGCRLQAVLKKREANRKKKLLKRRSQEQRQREEGEEEEDDEKVSGGQEQPLEKSEPSKQPEPEPELQFQPEPQPEPAAAEGPAVILPVENDHRRVLSDEDSAFERMMKELGGDLSPLGGFGGGGLAGGLLDTLGKRHFTPRN
jgi:hypothetical protein